jgi:hypothetical protein
MIVLKPRSRNLSFLGFLNPSAGSGILEVFLKTLILKTFLVLKKHIKPAFS